MSGFNQLSPSELQALLARAGTNPSPASLLLGGGQAQAPSPAELMAAQLQQLDATANGFPMLSSQPSMIQALLLQRQEEQQRALLLQQLAATTMPSVSSADSIALLLQRQHQQRQLQELQGLSTLGLTTSVDPRLSHFASLPAPGPQPMLDSMYGLPTMGATVQADPLKKLQVVSAANAATAQGGPLVAGPAAAEVPQRRRKGRTGTFPQKLHQMLSDLEREEGGTDIASFLPHGRAFAIHKPRDFVKLVMPKYFRMSRFSSFQRQLNLYEFQRITDGPDKGAYFHDMFVHGRPHLSTMMKRNKIKGVKKDKNPQAQRQQSVGDAQSSQDESHADEDSADDEDDDDE